MSPNEFSLNRRHLLGTAIAAAGTSVAMHGPFGLPLATAAAKPAGDKRYPFKKSINLWAFPYPQKMSLEQCLQLAKDAGFEGRSPEGLPHIGPPPRDRGGGTNADRNGEQLLQRRASASTSRARTCGRSRA